MAININAFMAIYNAKKTKEEKENLVKEHIVNEYVPYEKKVAVANAIVESSYWRTEKSPDGKETKVLHVDSIVKHMLTCMSIVKLYTNIKCRESEGKMLEDFNALNGSMVLDLVVKYIDERELKEFNNVIDLICEDTIKNEFENHAYITKQVNRFGELISVAIAPIVAQLDVDKIKEVMSKYI